jgi:hypothetical protein
MGGIERMILRLLPGTAQPGPNPGTPARDFRDRVHPLSLMVIVIILVFSAGCIENREEIDLFAAKFSDNGSLEWVRVIDSGQNDVGTGFNETTDGGYLITGGSYPSRCNGFTYQQIPIQPYQVRLSSGGRIESILNTSAYPGSYDYPSELFNRTGGFDVTSADGGRLSTYQKIKDNAVYYRLARTGADGTVLWDKPFFTLKGHPAPRHLTGETIIIQGIVPTYDKGYLVWGSREKVSLC